MSCLLLSKIHLVNKFCLCPSPTVYKKPNGEEGKIMYIPRFLAVKCIEYFSYERKMILK
jgi:hypothetical protein